MCRSYASKPRINGGVNPGIGDGGILRVEFKPYELEALKNRRLASATGPGERVDNQAARRRDQPAQIPHKLRRLHSGMRIFCGRGLIARGTVAILRQTCAAGEVRLHGRQMVQAFIAVAL